MEAVNLYSFYIFETEYSVIERLQNGYTLVLGLPNYAGIFSLFVFFLI